MNWTKYAIELAIRLGTALGERVAAAIGEPKQEAPDVDANAIGNAMSSGAARNRSSEATERTMDERIRELRTRIVTIAKSQEGKSDPDVYWREVLPQGDSPPYPKSWCGAGYMWCLHQAHTGLKVLNWKRGFGITSAFQVAKLPFPTTRDPKPGDMAYFTKNQHHAVVEEVAGGMVRLINFNGSGGEVTRTQASYTQATCYYSIGPALAAVAGKTEDSFTGDVQW